MAGRGFFFISIIVLLLLLLLLLLSCLVTLRISFPCGCCVSKIMAVDVSTGAECAVLAYICTLTEYLKVSTFGVQCPGKDKYRNEHIWHIKTGMVIY